MLVSALPLFVLGIWIQARASSWLRAPRALFVLLAVATSALVAFGILFFYITSPAVGHAASLAVWIATLAILLFPLERERVRRAVVDPEVALPLLAMLGTAFLYLGLSFGILPDPIPRDWTWLGNVTSGMVPGSPDNELPLTFATRLFDGAPLGHAADRGPVQAALVLVPMPLWRALQALLDDPSVVGSGYQVFAVLLQCTWVPAVFALLRLLGLRPGRVALVLLALIPSYFFFIHSVFAWPKLLAGSFAVGTFCLLLCRDRALPLPTPLAGAAAALAVLGFLSHGGVATALLAFGVVLSTPRFFPGWKNLLVGGAVIGVLFAPWFGVVKIVAPPGNHIAKVFLADARLKRPDPRSLGEAIVEKYASLSAAQHAEQKWRKLKTIVGVEMRPRLVDNRERGGDWEGLRRDVRRAQFLQLIPSLDVLNVGWVVVALGLWLAPAGSRIVYRRLAGVLGIALLSILVWVLLIFKQAIIQHGSYATMILLFTGLAAAIAQLPLRFGIPLLLLHAAIVPLSILGFPGNKQYVPLPLALAAATGVALVACLAMAHRRLEESSR